MSNKSDNPVYRKDIFALLESMILTDAWRDLNTNSRRYTWPSRGKSSWLDYWSISEHLLNNLANYKILPGLHSDNSILKISLVNNILNRGKVFWKFNTSLLHDQEYVTNIKEIINDCETEYSDLEDKGLAWEMTKLKIRSFSIPYNINQKKQKSAFKKSLEMELENLQKEIDETYDIDIIQNFTRTKKDLK